MDSILTVADCRTALERYASSAARFIPQLNQARQRLILSGKWKGVIGRYIFDSSDGFISLPPQFQSVLGQTYNRWPGPIFGQQHEFSYSGPGTVNDALGWLGQLIDMGDGYPTENDITKANEQASPEVEAEPGTIRLYSTGSDNGSTVRLFGIQQESGQPVGDADGVLGEELVLNAPFVDSLNHYSSLTDAAKEATKGPVAVWVVPSDGDAAYQIGSWLPQETRPRRRRYKTGRAENAIEVLCQLRYIPAVAETDFVIPSNLSALQCEIQALVYQETGYSEKAKVAHKDALGWLDDEAVSSRGGAQPTVPIMTWFGDPVPQTH